MADMSSWSILLPVPPSVNAMFANRGQEGKRGRMKSQDYRAWLDAASDELWLHKPLPRFKGQVTVLVAIEYQKALCDIDNRLKGPLDFLCAHNIIQGDDHRYVKMIVGSWDETVKGAKITVSRVE